MNLHKILSYKFNIVYRKIQIKPNKTKQIIKMFSIKMSIQIINIQFQVKYLKFVM